MKKTKLILISIVTSLVLLAGGLLTFFLLPNSENNGLKELLSNVSNQIFSSYDALAKSYNYEPTAQTQASKEANSKVRVTALASPSIDNNDDLWNTTEGSETFQSYLDNINDVMAHYAISEYLVENSKQLDFAKTYHFQSSTVEYYAKAEYTDKYFSFTLHNDNKDICVKVNITDNGNMGESIEFYKESRTTENKYYYQYSTLNFKTNTYEEISLLSKNMYNGSLTNEWIDNNIEEQNQHKMNHNDKSSYDGKNHKRNNNGANHHNDPKTQDMYNNVSQHKDKLFGQFDEKTPSKNNIKEFPNAQALQNYAFNKYVAKISYDANGKEFLEIQRTYQWVEMDAVLERYNFNEDTNIFSWEYKPDVEVLSQKVQGELIDINDRSCEVENFGLNTTLIFQCKRKNNYYNATFSKNSQHLEDYNIFSTNNFEGLCSEKHNILSADIDTTYCDCNKLQLIKNNDNSFLSLHSNAQMNDYRINAFDIIAQHYSNLMQEITIPTSDNTEEPEKNNIKIYSTNENYTKLINKISELTECANFSYWMNSDYFENAVIIGLNRQFAISKDYKSVSAYNELQLVVAKLFGFSDYNSLKNAVDLISSAYKENAIGVSTNTNTDRLKYDGAVYTTSNIFVLPFQIESSSNNGYTYNILAYIFVDESGQASILISNIDNAITMINYRKTTATDSNLKIEINGRCSLFETMSNILTWEYQSGFEIISQEIQYSKDGNTEKQKLNNTLRTFDLRTLTEIDQNNQIYLSVICRKNSKFYHGSISTSVPNSKTELVEQDISFIITTKSETKTIQICAYEITEISYQYLESEAGRDNVSENYYNQIIKNFDTSLREIDLSEFPNGTLIIEYKNFNGKHSMRYTAVNNIS